MDSRVLLKIYAGLFIPFLLAFGGSGGRKVIEIRFRQLVLVIFVAIVRTEVGTASAVVVLYLQTRFSCITL